MPTERPERLYLGTATLLGSNRVIGMAGAYAGVAESVDGLLSNVASVGHRSRGTREALAGALVQLGRAGIGLYVRSSQVDQRFVAAGPQGLSEEVVQIERDLVGLCGALALQKDQIILGFGFLITSANFIHEPRSGNTWAPTWRRAC